MRTLFQSRRYTSYQCDNSRCIFIDFQGKIIKFSFCQLLALRQQVKKIDLHTHFSGENKHGLEILVLCNREHIFILDTSEIIDLKDLIHGSFVMLELNSLVTF
ncbi:hypothetical protein LZ575_17195 [Antarcticibacterium sp. 1MA-6-2]|uniref:hypothetical protein n=1 Tax=Antarcticibacterium sp. 1MA-6-2 TaxID=2908210 RepID=UPI001F268AD2|nr:hypothetical protein [Antarcticibacterium sp. 1MA-6-2]UJH90520.1 hypothetical protein LZ575_17195 [Antarcticibacterium sp. 1MA-6-2]